MDVNRFTIGDRVAFMAYIFPEDVNKRRYAFRNALRKPIFGCVIGIREIPFDIHSPVRCHKPGEEFIPEKNFEAVWLVKVGIFTREMLVLDKDLIRLDRDVRGLPVPHEWFRKEDYWPKKYWDKFQNDDKDDKEES